MDWLSEIKSFSNVLVLPYTGTPAHSPNAKGNTGGPIWPSFENQGRIRHYRNSKPVDICPNLPANEVGGLSGEWWWGGAVTSHFGHQMSENMHRLGPSTLYRNPKFIFAINKSMGVSVNSIPSFFWEALEFLGYSRSQIFFIESPTLVETISVRPQGDILGGEIDQGYKEILCRYQDEKFPDRHIKCREKIYVSRINQKYGKVAGERVLVNSFRNAGYKVIYPELLSLREQMRLYANASEICFVEGSAVHGTELLGRLNSSTIILRRDRKISKRISKTLIKRSDRFEEIDAVAARVNVRGNSAKATSILSFNSMMEAFGQLKEKKGTELNLDKDDFYQSMRNDIVSSHKEPFEIISKGGEVEYIKKGDLDKFLKFIAS